MISSAIAGRTTRGVGSSGVMVVAIVFALAASAWFAVHPPTASVSMDDGAYAIAVREARDGAWSVPYGAVAVDPDGDAFPYVNAERSEEGFFPYVRQPAWIVALAAGDALAGPIGMRLLVILCAAGAVIVTGCLALEAGQRGAAELAALLIALSPLAFNALQLWAHVAAALGVGVAALGAMRVLDDRRWLLGTVLAVVGATAAGLARADGAVFALAVGVVVGLIGLSQRRVHIAAAGLAIAASAVAAQLATASFAERVVGGSGLGRATDSRAAGRLGDRLEAGLDTILSTANPPAGYALALFAFLLSLAAATLWRRADRRAAVILLLAAAGAWGVRIVVAGDELATGLLAAWPLAALLALTPWAKWPPQERRLLAVVLLGTLGIVVTQYDAAGGANWGGRFLAPALPLMAVLVASAVHRARIAGGSDGVRLARASVLLAVLTTAGSLVADSHFRTRSDERVERIEALASPDWVVTSSKALPNLAWRTYGDVRWLHVPEGAAGGAERLHWILVELGVEQVVLHEVDVGDVAPLVGRPVPELDARDQPVVVEISR